MGTRGGLSLLVGSSPCGGDIPVARGLSTFCQFGEEVDFAVVPGTDTGIVDLIEYAAGCMISPPTGTILASADRDDFDARLRAIEVAIARVRAIYSAERETA